MYSGEKIQAKNVKRTSKEGISREDLQIIVDFVNMTKEEGQFQALIKSKDLGFKEIGSGSSGTVFSYKNYAIKIFYSNGGEWYSTKDAIILNKLKGINIYPKLYARYKDIFVVMELVKGISLNDLCWKLHQGENVFINKDFKNIFIEGFKDTIRRGYEPYDLHGNNIIFTKEGNFIIVDIGCFFKTSKPLNENKLDEQVLEVYNLFSDSYLTDINDYIEACKNVVIVA